MMHAKEAKIISQKNEAPILANLFRKTEKVIAKKTKLGAFSVTFSINSCPAPHIRKEYLKTMRALGYTVSFVKINQSSFIEIQW